jgi:Protein of unknown function (DUF1559)
MRSYRVTLVDIAVAIALGSLGLVLMMPAVLSARTEARQQQCVQHFKFIGLALHNYHDTLGCFPPGRIWEREPMRPPHDHSVLTQLLPFIEQSSVYNSFNFHSGGWASVQNRTTRIQKIELFLCPDDQMNSVSAAIEPVGHPSNIAFSLGSKAWVTHPTHSSSNLGPAPEGMFFDNSNVKIRDIIDGTAVTLAAAEQVIDHARREGPSEVNGSCFGEQATGKQYFERSGSRWISGHPAGNYFTGSRAPNDSQADCFLGIYPVGLGSLNKTARSRHAGGVNVIVADGSVRFVRNEIDLPVWQAINTRAGQERIPESGF